MAETSHVPPAPPPRAYFPFKDVPFRVVMGLHALDVSDWIQIDNRFAAELALKQLLLAERHDEVFDARAGSEDASRACLELLVDHLLRYFPQWYRREGDTLRVLLTGDTHRLNDGTRHPLDLAARLVQEDLCLMQRDGEVYRLTAAAVCFPSRWLLKDKMGRDMLGIHAPVAFYKEQLGAKADRFMNLMPIEAPVWRLNWTLHDDPVLFQPTGHGRTQANGAITADNAGERLWIRVERQTLRRLPGCADILFTIRTYLRPLADLRATPERAADLAGAMRRLPQATFDYKSQGVFAAAALAWLDAVSSKR